MLKIKAKPSQQFMVEHANISNREKEKRTCEETSEENLNVIKKLRWQEN